MNDEIRGYLLPKFPMGRIGTPDDAARLITYLASEEVDGSRGRSSIPKVNLFKNNTE